MKMEITSKKLKRMYRVYRVNSSEIQYSFLGKPPKFYNSGVYGWNYDVYIIDDFKDIAIITGYRAFNCEMLDSEKIKKLQDKFSKLKQTAARERLINNFLDNIDDYLW